MTEPCLHENAYKDGIRSFVDMTRLFVAAESTLNRVKDLCADHEAIGLDIPTSEIRAVLKPVETQ